LRRVGGGKFAFSNLSQTLLFALIPCLLMPAISGALTSLFILPDSDQITLMPWVTWVLSSSLGTLALAPVILTFGRSQASCSINRHRCFEIIAVVLALWVATIWVFWNTSEASQNTHPRLYLSIPLMLWLALRFEQRGAAVGALVLSLPTVWLSTHGHGPFAMLELDSILINYPALWIFLFVIIFTSLGVGSIIAQRQKAEQRTAQTEAYYRETIRHSQSIVYRRHIRDKKYDYVSPNIEELLGIKPEEFSTTLLDEIIEQVTMRGEAEGMPHGEAVKLAQTNKMERWQADYRIRTRDGRTLFLADSSVLTTDENGEPTILLGIMHDVTARTIAESALRESESRFRLLTEAAPILIWMTDKNGWCTFVSRPGLIHLDLEIDDVLGNQWCRYLHPDQRTKYVKTVRSFFSERKMFQMEVECSLPSYEEPVWLLTGGNPRFNQDGEFAGYVGTCFDMSSRKADELNRQRITGYLTAVARVTSLMLTTTDPDDAIDAVLKILGQAASAHRCYWFENKRDSNGDIIACQRAEWFDERFCKPRSSETMSALPYEVLLPGGYNLLSSGGVINLSDDEMTPALAALLAPYNVKSQLVLPIFITGKFSGFIGFHDCLEKRTWAGEEINLLRAATDSLAHAFERRYSEQQRLDLETEILHSQKLESLGVLAGGIAHDFNNILVTILGNAGLAQEELPPDSPAQEILAEIETAAKRAADLTRQMLAYSGKGKFFVSDVDLNSLIRETLQLLEISISKKTELILELDDKLPIIEGDESQLRQILMNLVINASEALGGHRGTVIIRTFMQRYDAPLRPESPGDEVLPPGEYVHLEVQDMGEGMTDETRQRLFEPFFTTKFAGRGLGLAATLGIIQSHSGSIYVASEHGKGTTFTVILPTIEPQMGQPTPPGLFLFDDITPTHKNAPPLSKGTVLVADDEPSVRRLARRLFERMGFEVLAASDGREAVEIFQLEASRITLVLLDITMPQLNGLEVCRIIRSIRPNIKIILTSGYNEHDATAPFAGEKISGFLHKPYHADTFVEAVYRALS
jgi:PAS domain S-box-containing protein